MKPFNTSPSSRHFVEVLFLFIHFSSVFSCALIRTSLDWVRAHKIIIHIRTKCVICICYFLEFLFVTFWNLFIFIFFCARSRHMQCVFQFSFAFNKRLRVSRFSGECIGFLIRSMYFMY